MMHLRVVLFFLVLTGMWSCQSGSEQQTEDATYSKYYDSVMVIHDRTMPYMSTIENLRQQLKDKKETTEDQDEIMNINQLLGGLNKGEDAMFDWMQQFKPDSLQDDEKLRYIQNELINVQRMEDIMMDGIHQAQEFLGVDPK